MNLRVPTLALTLAVGAVAPLRAQDPETRTAQTAADSALRHNAGVRMRAAFRQAMAAQGITNPDALLLVTRVQRDMPVQLRVLEGTVPPPVLAALDSVVQNQVGPWPDAYVNTMLRPEEPMEVSDTASEVAPDLRNRGFLGGQLTRYLRDHPEVGPPGMRIDMRVRALVSRTGGIPYVELTRSSGKVQVDEEVMRIVRRMRVRPARVGGRPVDVWITLPVTLEIPEPLPQNDPAPPRTP